MRKKEDPRHAACMAGMLSLQVAHIDDLEFASCLQAGIYLKLLAEGTEEGCELFEPEVAAIEVGIPRFNISWPPVRDPVPPSRHLQGFVPEEGSL